MKGIATRILLFCSALGLLAQQPSEVVISATSGAKVVVGMAPVAVTGLEEPVVAQEFSGVLQKDLDESGVFGVLRERTPSSTDAKAWSLAGADWLVVAKASKAANGALMVGLQVLDTRAEKAVFSKNYNASAETFRLAGPMLRRTAHLVADDLVKQLTGERGVASTRMVFVRQVSPGVKEIFQVDRDGANLVQITSFGSLTLAPTVAQDGRLAFVTYKGGTPEIWGQRKPNGAFERLYPNAKQEGLCFSPAWSPDGKRLAFVQGDRRGNADIMVLDLDSGRARRLTDGAGINTSPCWNPSGTQIAFTSDREGGPQIYLMQDDGSNLRALTREGAYNESPAWSPSGAQIAYVSRFEGKFDLFVYKLGEGKAYQITTGVSSSESPAWSPDERRLVFTSNRFGSMQLFTTDLSGKSIQRLSELGNCQSPKWTRSR
jgi:TolB protein